MSETPSAPVIYAFGDGLSDAGDASLLTATPLAAQLGLVALPVSPPYATETYGGTTAGVFSNGPVWVQDLAGLLGAATPAPGEVGVTASALLTMLQERGGSVAANAAATVAALEKADGATGTDPYLQITAGAAGGTDFAIGGSVSGPSPENSEGTVGLTDLAAQLANFKAAVAQPVAGALYTVWDGTNDMLNLVEDARYAKLLANGTVATDIQDSVQNEVAMVSSLVASGAQSVLVPNVPDLGTVPDIASSKNATLIDQATTLAQDYDTALAAALQQADFGSAHVTLENTFSLIDGVEADSASNGLNVTGRVYDGTQTADDGTVVSTDPNIQNTYLFFDGLHTTETGQTLIAQGAQSALAAACFLRGTRIRTTRGDIAIEDLAVGDLVITASGAAQPIRWIGHRPFDTARHPNPEQVWPIRIRAGALAHGIPCRDLLVSPGHSLLLDGVLIQAERLVNGATITRDSSVTRSAYLHIEFPRHDIVISEGAASESYLDTGNRGAFLNGGGFTDLHPDFSPRPWTDTCVPLVQEGPVLAAVIDRLTHRALALGWQLNTGSIATLFVGNAPLRPVRRDGARISWNLPSGVRSVRLRSAAGIPAEDRPHETDRRRLGLLVAGVALIEGGRRRELALDDPRLTDGWHAVECCGSARRWTDGDAGLAVSGPCQLELLIERCFAAWVQPQERAA